MIPLLFPAATACGIALTLTPLLRMIATRAGLFDIPNARSSHVTPTPRGGGAGILAGLIVAAALSGALKDHVMILSIFATAIIAILGFIDDLRHLPAWAKFIVQVVTATGALWTGDLFLRRIALPFVTIPLGPLAAGVTILLVVGWINAYNFMDGVNGIAAVQAIIAGTVLAVLLWRSGDIRAAVIAAASAGGAAGFLPWNFPKARIFMGDVGSGSIGFLFAILILRVSPHVGIVAATLPLFPFLFDSSVTVLRRAVHGERFFTPHRTHFYQRLAQLSGSHVVVTVVWGILAVFSSVVALMYSSLSDGSRLLVLLAVVILHSLVAWAICWCSARVGTLPRQIS